MAALIALGVAFQAAVIAFELPAVVETTVQPEVAEHIAPSGAGVD